MFPFFAVLLVGINVAAHTHHKTIYAYFHINSIQFILFYLSLLDSVTMVVHSYYNKQITK